MTAPAPLLRISNVAKTFGGVHAVDDVSFAIDAGTITALIGPNGAGKSTLFNIISGFERPLRGRADFAGCCVTTMAPDAVARAGLVRTFQLPRMLGTLSVLDNMLVAAPDHPGERLRLVPLVRRWRSRERQAADHARALLRDFGLAAKEREYAGKLSGGQQKLLELARALMLSPRMLLLDEPLAGVNRTLGKSIVAHVERLRDESGLTFLFVEHDLDVVMRHAERVIVMANGRVIADGAPDTIRHSDEVLRAYLGSGDDEEAAR